MISRPANVFALLSLSTMLLAATAGAEDWHRWRGPDANGISKETGWQSQWPAEGPKQLWKVSVGTGFSSMTVSQGRVYTLGNDGDKTDTVYCLDAATGAIVWKYAYECALDPHFYEGGPSATPVENDGLVYSLSRKGDFFCLDAAKGTVIWKKDLHAGDFANEIPTWGFSGSPLVEGNLVILDVGAAGIAFDKKTGNPAWTSGKSVSGYATPVPFNSGKTRCVAISAVDTLEAIAVADGKKVWSFPWKTTYDINATDPIISDSKVFISSGIGHGCALLDISQAEPKVIWQNKNMKTHFNTSVLWDGYLYGVDESPALKCISWETGEVKWSDSKFGKGSLILADGKIIGLSDKGELIIAEASPACFKPISRAQVLGGKCWTTPVLSNGRIYCRNAKGDLVCLDVSGK
ncbi:MAG: qgdA [Pedosphaera sp.]|nr:qgdA [Pedosphaera sp.]